MVNEMRLVDLNSIVEQLENEWGYEGIREDLYKLPTVDAVPVVRCKDCRYAYINFVSVNSGVALCRLWTNHAEGKQAIIQHDDFCSYGERRNEK